MPSINACVAGLIVSLGCALTPAIIAAQDAPAAPASICGAKPCVLLFDWGPGKSSADFGADRRYGSGDDFESTVRRVLASHGIRLQNSPDGTDLTMTVRPKVDTRAMCEIMPGTNTDYSCAAVSDLQVVFTANTQGLKVPAGARLSGRCAGVGEYMTMVKFGTYTADMIWWTLNGSQVKEKKPSARC
jgi:hypothetical protein